jgi:hypothetical protein
MKLTITIDTDNDAFQPEDICDINEVAALEISRILQTLARDFEFAGLHQAGFSGAPIFDSNGNVVGEVNYK